MVSNSKRLCVCFVVILSVLPSISFLRNNPYVCDCKMSWFLKRLRLKDYTQLLVDVRRMKCHEPERLRGKLIYKLKEDDVCSKKMIMNECKLQIDQCHQHADCHDQNRGYRCSCRTGFTGSGWNCSDIDECRQTGVCSKANTKCVNTMGTYLCYCDRGFMLKNSKCEDINECSEGTATCPRHAICKNTKGSYTCNCKNGYVVKGSKTCVKKEIVTCSSSPGPCDFLTEDCIQGQSLGRYNCRCKKGFTRSDNGVCTDINECNKNHELCESIAECKNTPGSYKCICPEGYEAADEDTCDDIDECATGMDNCHRDAERNNFKRSRTSSGGAHYIMAANSEMLRVCFLIVFFVASISRLDNNPYVCDCKISWFLRSLRLKDYTQKIVGLKKMKCDKPARLRGQLIYKLKEDEVCFNKTILDECKLQIDQCHQHADCHDQNKGYRCFCRTGFTGNGWNCSDIDECRQTGVCSKANTKCVNTLGTYLCYCDRDINECSEEIVTCSSSPGPCDFVTEDCIQGQSSGRYNCRCNSLAKCNNTQGSYECICRRGYENKRMFVQVDIDECAAGMDNCHRDAVCINNIGSYTCKAGFLQYENGRLCQQEKIVSLNGAKKFGFYMFPWRKCRKFAFSRKKLFCDKMGAKSVPYHIFEAPYKVIKLAENPYVCDCQISWFLRKLRLKDYTQKIIDLKRMKCHKPKRLRGRLIYELKEFDVCPYRVPNRNECKLQIDECHQHADCHDQSVGYKCSCQTGFTGNGWNCSDIDECRQTGVCSKANTKCVNTLGTYLCYCNRGFMLKNSKCEDINECSEGTATCPRHAICKNTKGSYTCTCKNGYVVKDSKTCVKKEIVTCSSSPGPCDFVTEDCIQGQSLENIDECIANNDTCNSLAECKNTHGSYECICPEGYRKDENTCEDIDECAEELDNCHRDAVCINSIGSYICICKAGFQQFENGTLCLKGEKEDEFLFTATIILACLIVFEVLGSLTLIKLTRKLRLKDYTQKIIDLKKMKCHAPAKMRGKLIYKLKEADVCPEQTIGTNECKLQIDECHQHADCHDLYVGYRCVCRRGFTGDGWNCSDIDECQEDDVCQNDLRKCENILAMYACPCDRGYKEGGSGLCTDIDECSEFTATCPRHAICKNNIGSYTCTCKNGYVKNDEGNICTKKRM
ncbi:fibrillin-1-like [Xenia sp. Carnegie-2017]|uniref:fibrillin-1-like n=1 Tax=Xenia sp. Carnegie-2017 TaxID=2897299 RepID=UPI001F038FD0|nr:fibrillin-1-like [Xenia sp. Carnegie-2017]